MQKFTRKKSKTRKRILRGGRLTLDGLKFLIEHCDTVEPKNVTSLREYLADERMVELMLKERVQNFSNRDLRLYIKYMGSSGPSKRNIRKIIQKRDKQPKTVRNPPKAPPPSLAASVASNPSLLSSSSSSSGSEGGPYPGDRGGLVERAGEVESLRRRIYVGHRKSSFEAENKRAVSVVIYGASESPAASYVNGFFDPSTSKGMDGRLIYIKRGQTDVCLEHFNGQWQVKPVSEIGKDSFFATLQGNRALLDCSSNQWTLADGRGGSMRPPRPIRLVSEQQYMLEAAAEEAQRRHNLEKDAERLRREALQQDQARLAAAERNRQAAAELEAQRRQAAAAEAQRRRDAQAVEAAERDRQTALQAAEAAAAAERDRLALLQAEQAPPAAAAERPKPQRKRWIKDRDVELFVDESSKEPLKVLKPKRKRWIKGEDVELFVDESSENQLKVLPLSSEVDISSAESVNPAYSSSSEDDLDSLGSRLSSIGSQRRQLFNSDADPFNSESQNSDAGPGLASPGLASPIPFSKTPLPVSPLSLSPGDVKNLRTNFASLPLAQHESPESPTGNLARSLSGLSVRPPGNSAAAEADAAAEAAAAVNRVYNVTIQYTPEHPRKPVQKSTVLTITNQGVTITIDGQSATLDVTVLREVLYFNVARSIDMRETCRDSITPARENTARNFASSKCVKITTKREAIHQTPSLAPTSITIPFTINFNNIDECDEFLRHLDTIRGRNQQGGKRKNNTRKQSHKKTHKYIQPRRRHKTKKSKRSTRSKRY